MIAGRVARCKLFLNEHRDAPKPREKTKERQWKKLKPLVPITTPNIKHSPHPSPIHIKPHAKGLFISVPVTQYNMSSFEQKITMHTKCKGKNLV